MSLARPGRAALLVVGATYVVALGWAAVVLPARVPSHFDAVGRVDDWSSRGGVLALWAGVGLVVLVGIPALARVATRGDGTWVNMPQASKDHWFAPERRAEFRVRFSDDMEGFGALTGVLLLALLAVTTWVGATGRDGAPPWALAGLVGAYLLATVWWIVRLLRAYRPPAA